MRKVLKDDIGKIRMDLIPAEALEALGEILTFGLINHDENSWRKVEFYRYEAAMLRHYTKWKKGELVDDESGKSHLWHVLTNAAFLVALEKK